MCPFGEVFVEQVKPYAMEFKSLTALAQNI